MSALSPSGRYIAALVLLSLLALYAPKVAGLIVVLVVIVLALKTSEKGLL